MLQMVMERTPSALVALTGNVQEQHRDRLVVPWMHTAAVSIAEAQLAYFGRLLRSFALHWW